MVSNEASCQLYWSVQHQIRLAYYSLRKQHSDLRYMLITRYSHNWMLYVTNKTNYWKFNSCRWVCCPFWLLSHRCIIVAEDRSILPSDFRRDWRSAATEGGGQSIYCDVSLESQQPSAGGRLLVPKTSSHRSPVSGALSGSRVVFRFLVGYLRRDPGASMYDAYWIPPIFTKFINSPYFRQQI